MDTTETNIKMNWKAREIQDSHEPQEGDYYWEDGCGSPYLTILSAKSDDYFMQALGAPVWLPRQDQLQEMVGGWALGLLDKFYNFCMWDEQFEELRDKMTPISMEQLWLCFVMKEKYNTVWNGEEWMSTVEAVKH
jgi:hypothetical protein